jgi:hypothetical protein
MQMREIQRVFLYVLWEGVGRDARRKRDKR